jgi:hypothetical protein
MLNIEENMKIKILTHRISLITGSCYADWISVPKSENMQKKADEMRQSVINGEYDNKDFAIRMRKYPTSKHLRSVKLQDSAKWGIC